MTRSALRGPRCRARCGAPFWSERGENEALLAALRDFGTARRDLVAVGTSSPLDEAALDDALEAVRSRAEAVQAAARAALREAFVDASR